MGLLETTIGCVAPADEATRAAARARLERLTMPHWALGRLLDLAVDLAGMTRSMNPPVARRTIVVMAGDHGVVAEGVSKYPAAVTVQMVHNFVNEGASINALARVAGARVVVVDMGVAGDLSELVRSGRIVSRRIAAGTRNIAVGPAMSPDEAVRSVEAGIEVAHELAAGVDVFGTGEMGIGNTTPSAAIAAAMTGLDPAMVTGRGTGLSDAQLKHKVDVVARALAVNHPKPADGLDVLAKVGGFEIGGLAGLILGAAALGRPVLVDGFIATAAALIARALAPSSVDYMIAAHLSAEPGHLSMGELLGRQPLLDLDLRLGEGSGAALALPLLDAAVNVLTRVATFDEAHVSGADR